METFRMIFEMIVWFVSAGAMFIAFLSCDTNTKIAFGFLSLWLLIAFAR
jgi:hypothetical protein